MHENTSMQMLESKTKSVSIHWKLISNREAKKRGVCWEKVTFTLDIFSHLTLKVRIYPAKEKLFFSKLFQTGQIEFLLFSIRLD